MKSCRHVPERTFVTPQYYCSSTGAVAAWTNFRIWACSVSPQQGAHICAARTTPKRLEPLQTGPNGFRPHLLNRSVTVSCSSAAEHFQFCLLCRYHALVRHAATVTSNALWQLKATPQITAYARHTRHWMALLFYVVWTGAAHGTFMRNVTRGQIWTHWDMNPGASACEAEVIPQR